MKKFINKIFIISLIITLLGCTGKELKKYGGNLAVNGSGGNPVMAGVGLAVGGTLYGIGSLVDDKNEEEQKEDYYNEPRKTNYLKQGEIINEKYD